MASTTPPDWYQGNDSAYNPAQLTQYLTFLGLPPFSHPPSVSLEYLNQLFTHQITALPYENLSIHYSPSHSISLSPSILFHKMISQNRGRGGYCMELSLLFHHVLRALGFPVYLSGVRIRARVNGVPSGPYIGFVHLVNIVTLSKGQRYALDIAFGGDGPTLPMPLIPGLVHHNSIGTQEIRYIHEFIPGQRFREDGGNKCWIYQYRNSPKKEWNSYYAFDAQHEMYEGDFANLSYYISQSPNSHQSYTPLVVKFFRGPETERDEKTGEERERVKVVGKAMLVNGEVKKNLTGKTEVVKICQTEEERVEILKELFGIELTEEERGAIKGWRAELCEDGERRVGEWIGRGMV
ncbi:PaNAT1 arylamine N-acetyltransferase encoded by the PaNAT1 protein [Podospora australis]|uniref:PaNAT1 arylamine N-acetyltransferase encoded by the PaNAT1 protein n=1 Tax=Podospora australis TaxID=1536484 RepID=A0AAN7AIN4_9PEZI|nr:PaNAT1 arylamine N-acetyltransferase encoded by the PaNAT1 protein [Podospora australis]